MPDITALRFESVSNNGFETIEERDTLLSVEVGDFDAERGIDLHIAPRTDDVRTVSVSAEEAWQLARELARAAGALERGRA